MTRVLLFVRFPWFIDETLFAYWARAVQAFPDQRFSALNDKEGLLSSWISAGLIGGGLAPIDAVRLLSAVGTLVTAATIGWLLWRRLGSTVAVIAGGLVLLAPFFLVHGSIGIYDPMICGLTGLAVCLAVLMARTLRLDVALILGAVIGAGLLIKSTIAVVFLLIPITFLLVDRRRHRAVPRWVGLTALALAIGGAMSMLARLSPLYYLPGPDNHKSPSEVFDGLGPRAEQNIPNLWDALVGYLTIPGMALAVAGAVVCWRRDRVLTALLVVWTLGPIASTILLPYNAFPRYFSTAVAPFYALVAIGVVALAVVLHRALSARTPRWAVLATAGVITVLALPALVLNARVLADPKTVSYPGQDANQYVRGWPAVEPAHQLAAAIRSRSPGTEPVTVVTVGTHGWALDLLLNPGMRQAVERFSFTYADPANNVPPQTRFVVRDDGKPAPAGFRSVLRIRRPQEGMVVELLERRA